MKPAKATIFLAVTAVFVPSGHGSCSSVRSSAQELMTPVQRLQSQVYAGDTGFMRLGTPSTSVSTGSLLRFTADGAALDLGGESTLVRYVRPLTATPGPVLLIRALARDEDRKALALARARAETVGRWLIASGVQPDRLRLDDSVGPEEGVELRLILSPASPATR